MIEQTQRQGVTMLYGLGANPPPTGITVYGQALIEDGAVIGEGTRIGHGAHIRKGARIGRDCLIGAHCYIDKNVQIGNGCSIQNGVNIYDPAILEDEVFVGPCAVFTNVRKPKAFQKASGYDQIYIKEGASIGANSTIVCPCTIGTRSVVGAGCVVVTDIPDFTTVVGNPARPIKAKPTLGSSKPL